MSTTQHTQCLQTIMTHGYRYMRISAILPAKDSEAHSLVELKPKRKEADKLAV